MDALQFKNPGLNCPDCNGRIEVSIQELLTANEFRCPYCGLCLSLNRKDSRQAMEALEKVRQAQQRVEETSKFSR